MYKVTLYFDNKIDAEDLYQRVKESLGYSHNAMGQNGQILALGVVSAKKVTLRKPKNSK